MCVPRQQGSVGGRSLPNSWFRCTHLLGKSHASIFFSQVVHWVVASPVRGGWGRGQTEGTVIAS